MMFAYVNIFKPPIIKISLEELTPQLEENVYGDYSPMDIINNEKKYASNTEKIRKADLSYPILVDSNYNIIDGYHRLMKAYLEHKKEIKVYVIDKTLKKNFILGKKENKKDVLEKLSISYFLELWSKRFCK